MKKFTKYLAASSALLVLLLALVEGLTFLLVNRGLIAAPRPNYGRETYWWGDHPDFGVWRYSNAEFHHRTGCFDVRYKANSVGMRDRERPRESRDRRVVVLGDSFMEGWGIPDAQRVSNRLEQATGIAHLNFAMAHFGTYQQYLAYTKLARQYSHDAVIIGFLPLNDFRDTDYELAKRFAGYEYVYRPYLRGAAAPYVHHDRREPPVRKFLRRYSFAFNAVLPALGSGGGQGTMMWTPAEREGQKPLTRFAPSWFYDFTDEQVRRVEHILGGIANEASGKRVYVVLIPSAFDFYRYLISGPDPLEARLKSLERPDVRVINLLPVMAADPRQSYRFVLDCDPHWSAYANEVAAEHLLKTIGPELYGHAIE